MAVGLLKLVPGSTFAGEFRVVRPLAGGGMGSVYVVEQLSTGKPRALKVMHPQMLMDTKLRERFVQEAKIGARIESDHVVEVVGAGIDEESDTPWLAMELLRGEDLLSLVRRGGALSASDVREVFAQLCHAIGAAHDAGIVHRDLKPDNVFLASPRRVGVPFTVKVLDFGIAKVVAEAATLHTQAIGTPMWMSPEQTEAGHPLKPSADVWALGLVAFYLLVGRPYWKSPNTGESSPVSLLREVAIEPLVPASERASLFGLGARLPAGFDAWFSRCVTRVTRDRFPHAREAGAALDALLAASPEKTASPLVERLRSSPEIASLAERRGELPPSSSPHTPERPLQKTLPMTSTSARSRGVLWAAIAGGAVLATTATVSTVWMVRKPEPTTTRAGTTTGAKVLEPLGPQNQDEPQPTGALGGQSGGLGMTGTPMPPLGPKTLGTPMPSLSLPLPTAWPSVTLTTVGTEGDPPPIKTATPPTATGTSPPVATTDPPKSGFDKEAATTALNSVAYQDCGTGGPGTISVMFSPKGHAQHAYVLTGDYDDMAKVCIGQRFAKTKVPPFDGPPQLVTMKIQLPPGKNKNPPGSY